ncbi:MAG TPA: hypothetical protein VE135_17450 [Pyrinomonadaceae bacterium]|nr:hypothetical protein [Pyrinomonadaceae bacterium]
MKDAEKNKIDILLRNLAKSQRVESTSPDGREAVEGKHLDADELSSFAEGRLTAPTRSLYAAHLADCDRCRRIVSQLALAAGVGVVTNEPVAKSRSWTFLTALFSPVVMRYAIPALAVVILAAAGLVWIKREPARESVAQQTQTQTGPTSTALDSKPQTLADARSANSPPAEAAKRAETKTATGSEGERKDKSDDSTSARSNEKSKAEAKSTGSTAVAASPAPAKEAGAYAPPPPARTEQEAAKDSPPAAGEVAKQRPQETVDSVARIEDEERGRREKAAEGNKKVARRGAPATGMFGGLASQAGGSDATRSVSGRNFRRVDNVWVDTAYSSSMSTTEVNRGSEQFRALIGDEPGLRTIADQLDGEVIVVWKGKAYRLK